MPPGVTWVSKDGLNSNWEIWCANMEPKSLKHFKKTCFFDDFFAILTVFRRLCNLGSILAHQTSKFKFRGSWHIFWHPWNPWGHVNSGDTRVQRFVFFIFLHVSAIWWILFIVVKLKPDVTFIDWTWIKMTKSLFIATMAEFSKWYKLWVL